MKAVIIGTPLSGKSTLANKLALLEKSPVYRTDNIIFKLKKQNNLSADTFNAEITKIVTTDNWIVEGRHVSETLLSQATKVIWLKPLILIPLMRKIKQSGVNTELFKWLLEICKYQYFGQMDKNQLSNPQYSHNKKYMQLLMPYQGKLEVRK